MVPAADPKVIAEVVRLPAALTIPGDVLAGASAGLRPPSLLRDSLMTISSASIYLAGMALNDYADREADAIERPDRPIPSGRISADEVRNIATQLAGTGAGLALVADGPRAIPGTAALLAAVTAYDFKLSDTSQGTVAMAACRMLNVFQGAGPGYRRQATLAALAIAIHTAALTHVSRVEVSGGNASFPGAALAGTAAVVAVAAHVICRGRKPAGAAGVLVGLGLLAAYANEMVRGYRLAVDDPTPENMKAAVGRAVLGFIPLQSAIAAGKGRPVSALANAALWPVAMKLARRRKVT